MTADGQIKEPVPADVTEAATRAVDADREDFLIAKVSDNTFNLRKVAIMVVEGAILAERERCARLVEQGYPRDIAGKYDMCAHSKHKWEDCDSCAAAAIRKGGA